MAKSTPKTNAFGLSLDSFKTQNNAHNTQVKKRKQKHPRINMAFYNDNLDFVNLMARISGCSATEYVNRLIEADKKLNAEKVELAAKLFNDMKF